MTQAAAVGAGNPAAEPGERAQAGSALSGTTPVEAESGDSTEGAATAAEFEAAMGALFEATSEAAGTATLIGLLLLLTGAAWMVGGVALIANTAPRAVAAACGVGVVLEVAQVFVFRAGLMSIVALVAGVMALVVVPEPRPAWAEV